MTIVNLQGVGNNYGISIYRDSAFSSRVEPIEFLTPTTKVFSLPTLLGIRVDSVYEFLTGAWSQRQDVRISGNSILLDTVPTGQIAIIPKGYVSLVQVLAKASIPVQLFVKTYPGFITENFTVTTLDADTAAVGPFVFSLTEGGTYTDSLGPIAVPESFWIKSIATALVAKKTIPLVITSDIYL